MTHRDVRAGLEVGSPSSNAIFQRCRWPSLDSSLLDLGSPSDVRGVVSHLQRLPCPIAPVAFERVAPPPPEVSHGGAAAEAWLQPPYRHQPSVTSRRTRPSATSTPTRACVAASTAGSRAATDTSPRTTRTYWLIRSAVARRRLASASVWPRPPASWAWGYVPYAEQPSVGDAKHWFIRALHSFALPHDTQSAANRKTRDPRVSPKAPAKLVGELKPLWKGS
jgi:hypothetical protein